LGITKKLKKEKFEKNCFHDIHTISNVSLYKNLNGLIKQIYFSKKALGFIIEVYFRYYSPLNIIRLYIEFINNTIKILFSYIFLKNLNGNGEDRLLFIIISAF
jgi:hypothetical protein